MPKPFWLRRKTQALPRTVKNTIPKRLIFYDTETYINTDDNGKTHFPLRLGVARYIELDKDLDIINEETCLFRHQSEFIDFCLKHSKKAKRIYLFAHNSGFDIRVMDLHVEFNRLGYTSEPPIINNRVFIWDVKTSINTWTFLDTANYGVSTVDNLGVDMGYPKLTVDFDTVTDDDLMIYCARDVEILEKFIINYLRFLFNNDLGAFRSTIASQAFNTYRYRFMKIQPQIHNNEDALKLERDSYFGGRVECRFIGELNSDHYYYVDFNSMYPYIMMTKPVPYKFRGFTKNVNLRLLRMRAKTSYVIARVLISTEEPAYAIKRNGKLVFPIGIFKAVLHNEDILHAIKSGHILHCYDCAVYEARNIFDQYVEFFYNLKVRYTKEHNNSWRFITKLFLNSLYGKFGQRETTREMIGESESDDIFRLSCYSDASFEHYQLVMWFGSLFKEAKLGETIYSCPAIAASITAYARKRLWDILKIAGEDNIFYMDTDSYITNQQGYDNLAEYINPDILGMLAIEDKSDSVTIHGNKDYVFGETVKHKGLPKTAIQLDDNLWQYTQFQGFLTWLNLGAKGGMTAQIRTKRRLQNYNKGIVDHQTGKVYPIRLGIEYRV